MADHDAAMERNLQVNLSADMLAMVLECDFATGTLRWKPRGPELFHDNARWSAAEMCRSWNTKYAGAEAFTAHNAFGYRIGRVFSQSKLAHRVVWALAYGDWPNGEVDHINRVRSDNRLSNLRAVSHAENSRNRRKPVNNTSGHLGVSFHKRLSKWQASVNAYGVKQHVGYFNTAEEAVEARRVVFEKTVRLHGTDADKDLLLTRRAGGACWA